MKSDCLEPLNIRVDSDGGNKLHEASYTGGTGHTRHRQERTEDHFVSELPGTAIPGDRSFFRWTQILWLPHLLGGFVHSVQWLFNCDQFFWKHIWEFLEFLSYVGLNSSSSFDKQQNAGRWLKMSYVTVAKVNAPLKFLNKANIQ